jgi:cyclohexanecarboxylate-CoA ligase
MSRYYEAFEEESLFHEFDHEKLHRLCAWGEMSIGDHLEYRAAEHGDELAVRDDDRSLTWTAMEDRADSLAAALQERGIEEGDRVALQLPNVVEWYVARLGIFRAGGVTATLMPRYRRHEIEHLIATETPSAYIGPGSYRGYDHVSTLLDLRDSVGSLEHVIATGEDLPAGAEPFDDLIETSTTDFEPAGLGADYPDRLRHTGGTTGMPKPVYWSSNTRRAWIEPICDWFGITPYDRILGLAPFPHGISLPLAFTGILLTGAKSYITDPGHTPEEFWRLVDRYEPTVITAAPTQLNKMKSVADEVDVTLDSVRLVSFSGEPMPTATTDFFEDRGTTVVSYYGVTEGGGAFIVQPGERPEVRRKTAGKPMPFVKMRVVDDGGQELPHGEVGELHYSGPNLAFGFYDAPDQTREDYFVEDGTVWIKTGDAAATDADGNVRLRGRVDDMILRGGQNIFPAPIEDRIAELDGVTEVAIVGMPDPEYGQRACAFVVGDPDLTLEDITATLDEAGLAKYKWPERLKHVDEMPKTAANKIDKMTLSDRIEETLREEGRL